MDMNLGNDVEGRITDAQGQVLTSASSYNDETGDGGAQGQLRDSAGRVVRATADKLHQAASALRSRSADAQDQIASQSAKVGNVGTRLAGRTASAIDSAAGYVESVSIPDMQERVVDLIRQYPLRAVAIGAGVGFLASRILRR